MSIQLNLIDHPACGTWVKPAAVFLMVKPVGMEAAAYQSPAGAEWTVQTLPSGKHTKNYWKWPFTVSFPMKNGDFP